MWKWFGTKAAKATILDDIVFIEVGKNEGLSMIDLSSSIRMPIHDPMTILFYESIQGRKKA